MWLIRNVLIRIRILLLIWFGSGTRSKTQICPRLAKNYQKNSASLLCILQNKNRYQVTVTNMWYLILNWTNLLFYFSFWTFSLNKFCLNQCGGSGSVESVSFPWIRIRIKKAWIRNQDPYQIIRIQIQLKQLKTENNLNFFTLI